MLRDYEQRLIDERQELHIKLEKLTEFIYSGKIDKVNAYEQGLLRRQEVVMAEYLDILNKRVKHQEVIRQKTGRAQVSQPKYEQLAQVASYGDIAVQQAL